MTTTKVGQIYHDNIRTISTHYSSFTLKLSGRSDPYKKDTKRNLAQMEDGPATEAEPKSKNDTFPERCGKRLKSTQITITAGPEKEAFSIHQNVADKSPVLAELCAKASNGHQIDLPDEDAHNIGHLLEYLYTGNFSALSDEQPAEPTSEDRTHQTASSDELCQMYALAEKYQLPGLQRSVVAKFEALQDPNYSPVAFLDSAKKMYGQIDQADRIYREFFIMSVKKALESTAINKAVEDWIDQDAVRDTRLAKDVFAAQRELDATQSKLRYANDEIEEDNATLDRLRQHHAEAHYHHCDWEE
ncbi:MAG: hypothetical protein Q9169_003847 [Polycauliona sp. 2 TL-2023]